MLVTDFKRQIIEPSFNGLVPAVFVDRLPLSENSDDILYFPTPKNMLWGVHFYKDGNCIGFRSGLSAGESIYRDIIAAFQNTPPQKQIPRDKDVSAEQTVAQAHAKYFAEIKKPVLSYEAELNALVGMEGPKTAVRKLARLAEMVQRRKLIGLPDLNLSFHTVLLGGPGTGKTTFARIYAKVLHQHGLLPSPRFKEVDRSDLVRGYIGQSEGAVKEILLSTVGGVCFIDEFYALNVDGRDFGAQIIAVLVKFVEDHKHEMCVVIAGYPEPMMDAIKSNAGLKRRFTEFINFPDYSAEELALIFDRLVLNKQFVIEEGAYPVIGAAIKAHHANRGPDFGNAGDIKNLFRAMLRAHADRVISSGETDITQFVVEDAQEAARVAFGL